MIDLDLRRSLVAFMLAAAATPPSRRIIPAAAAASGPIARTTDSRMATGAASRPERPRRARRCCRATPSPSTASISRPASSPIRRPPERSRCSINRASVRPRSSTPPMSAKSANPAARPVTFVFNGGPGAASAFLNLGLVGPRIAEFGMDGHDGANVHLVDNPRYLARLHRSGADRSGRHRLEPAGQARRRQRILERAPRRRIDGESHRALCRQERPRQLAEIHSRRKLWRLSRRQGRARACRAIRASWFPES